MLETNYLNDYYAFIESHKLADTDPNIPVHQHHVVPLCIGGSNDKSNLVQLLPKDHLKAHELLYKALHGCAVALAHVIVSMAGKDNCDAVTLSDDALDEYNIRLSDAILIAKQTNANKMKRIVYKLEDLSMLRIPLLEPLPAGCIEAPATKNAWIFKGDMKKMWDKDSVPYGWRKISDATSEERRALFADCIANSMKGARWICNV